MRSPRKRLARTAITELNQVYGELNEDQRMIEQSVERFLADNYLFDERRLMEPRKRAFDPKIWGELAELGIMALLVPEELGGLGGGTRDAQIVTRLLGRSMVREPWMACMVLAAGAVHEVATAEQQAELVAPLATGEGLLSLAWLESGGRFNPAHVATRAERTGEGWRLNGRKIMALGLPVADKVLLTARTAGDKRDAEGISLFVVDKDTAGLNVRSYFTIDGGAAADIGLVDVIVPETALLGAAGESLPGLRRALDRAMVVQCADAVGAMEAMHEKTVEYTKTRVTFGKPLSQQQVIQHRLVDMAVQIDQAMSLTTAAAEAIDAGSPRAAILAAAAKALVGGESRSVAQWAVQLHGAIGYTDELDIGHYFRRLTQFDTLFGNRDHHLRRYFQLRRDGGTMGSAMFELDGLTDEDLAFQQEVRQFLKDNLTPEMIEARERTMWAYSEFEAARKWQRILAKRGWTVPTWPLEYGGTGWSLNQNLIWSLESARAKAPIWAGTGQVLCAPCIMAFGTDEQKAEFLPGIASGDDYWAQGYSEPGAGSDLANLQTRATRDGDYYVVNGSKIWSTFAHVSNGIFCLVRTSTEAKKQQGITFLLVDLDTPGITIRPILNLAGEHEFNEVFFEDVRVPVSRRLGEEGQGWTVAKHLLKFEHGGNMNVVFDLESRVAEVERLARLEADGCGATLWDDTDFQLRFAEAAVAAEGVIAAAKLTLASLRGGGAPGSQSELRNIRLREASMRLTELMIDAIGPYGAVDQGEAQFAGSTAAPVGEEHHRTPTAFYMSQRAATIAGGTPEIHRNNLARHHLHL